MLFRIAFLLLAVLVLLGFAEGTAAVVERLHPQSVDIGFDYAPYRMLRMDRGPWPLNRDGFRARELETYRDGFLIEFLGGSACLGVGDHPGSTVAERLQYALDRRRLARAQVLNLCQGGATSAQELAIFIQYGLPLEPQVVLSFDGANDLLHPRPVGTDDAPNLPYRDREMRAGFDGHHSLLSHLALFRMAGRIAKRRREDPAKSAAVPPEAIIASYEYVLGITHGLAQSSGAYYAVLLQPTLHYRKPWSTEERRMWNDRDPDYGAQVSEAARNVYAAADDALMRWAAGSGTRLFDLTGAFENTSDTVYSDSVHFTGERGNRVLYEQLETQGLADEIERRYRAWERHTRKQSANHASGALESREPAMPGHPLWAQGQAR